MYSVCFCVEQKSNGAFKMNQIARYARDAFENGLQYPIRWMQLLVGR